MISAFLAIVIPNLAQYVLIYIVIVFSAIVHEYAHAWTAEQLGDTTAKEAGRLTLNPFRHIDFFGTVLMPLLSLLAFRVFIGWAKPVPIDPRALRGRLGELKVAAAGPGANVLVAVILGMAVRFLSPAALRGFGLPAGAGDLILFVLGLTAYINIFIALFNLIPIAPLDGSRILPRALPSAAEGLLNRSVLGLLLAVLVASIIIPPLAGFFFSAITGQGSLFGGGGA
ncbi:site-2 protease family protein [Candidatus Parcubacteria bacterium]|nr:site-2 protease family protein [Candidatus Parcubacteria bacterium]MBI4385351.1 site-2 protease family protein [Candidatus Parcubacteria bacterium]